MKSKLHAVTAAVLGTLVSAAPAIAQTAQGGANANVNTTGANANVNANTNVDTTERTASNDAVCPAGCVRATAARQLTPEQRRRRAEAARAARERRATMEQERAARERADQERLAMEEAERTRLDRERKDEIAREMTRLAQLSQQTGAEQARLAQLRAERDRIERERAAMLAMPQPARGGGPVMMDRERRTRFVVGLEGGVGVFDQGARQATWPGGLWGARVGVDFARWIGIEGRYIGVYNGGYDPNVGQGVGLLTNGGAATLRLQAPIPFVQPYVFGGAGVYHTAVTGDRQARQASNLRETTNLAIPVGVGLTIPITEHWEVGAEGTFHNIRGERFSSDPNLANGNLWTGSGVLRWRL